MLITRKKSLAGFYLRLLDNLPCRVITSGEIAKQILTSSTNFRIVILDFSLQDKKGSVQKILKKVLATPDVYILVMATNDLQLKAIHSTIGKHLYTDRLCIVNGLSCLWLGPIKILKWKKQVLKATEHQSIKPK